MFSEGEMEARVGQMEKVVEGSWEGGETVVACIA